MRFFSELFRCKSILYFSYPSQFVPDPFISLSVLFVDNQIRFVSSHFQCSANGAAHIPFVSNQFHADSCLRQSNLFPFRSFPLHSSSDRSLHWLFWTVRHVAHAIKILALPWQFMAVRRISISNPTIAQQFQFQAPLRLSFPFPRDRFDSSAYLTSAVPELVHSYSVRSSPFLFGFAVVYYFLLPKTPCLCTSLRILSPLIYPAESAADSSLIFFMISSRSDR